MPVNEIEVDNSAQSSEELKIAKEPFSAKQSQHQMSDDSHSKTHSGGILSSLRNFISNYKGMK